MSGIESSFIDKLTSKQTITNKFLATEDGSCSSCGSKSVPMEQNITLFPLLATKNYGRSKKIADVINENFSSNFPPFRKRCDSCQDAGVEEDSKQFAKETRKLSYLSSILILQVDKFDARMKIVNKNIVKP